MIRTIMPLMLAMASLLPAAEPALVELIEPERDEPWLGQRLDFAVEVAVEGRFAGSTVFDLPELPGAILFRPEARPVLSSRQIEGREYSVQRHGFSLFCQRPESVTIDRIMVRCGSILKIGAEAVEHRLEVPAFVVEPRAQPDLLPGQLVVSSRRFEVEEQWDPTPGDAKPGDAFRRTVTITASDIPGMLLPKLPQPDFDGLAVYPSAPSVNDRTERGEFTGQRSESVTYLCETGGDFELPAVRFRCWDPEKEEWIVRELDVATIRVEAGTIEAAEEPVPRKKRRRRIAALFLLLLAGTYGALRFRKSRHTPEARAFDEFRDACLEHSPAEALHTFHRWHSTSRATAPGPELQAELRRTEEAVAGRTDTWSGEELLKAARQLRKASRQPSTDTKRDLKPLNP